MISYIKSLLTSSASIEDLLSMDNGKSVRTGPTSRPELGGTSSGLARYL